MDQELTHKLDAFFEKYTPQVFPKSAILIRAGEAPKGIFYLKKGHVRQYVITQNGEEMTLHMYKPGAFFPMSWAFNENPNLYYFESMSEVEVLVAPKDAVLVFVKKEPDILFDLAKRVFSGLDGILTRMEQLMSGNARARLITILVISAKRFGEVRKNGIVIHLKLTHQDLASLAGLSRETVSREMMQLKEKKLIGYTASTITIYNLQNLEG